MVEKKINFCSERKLIMEQLFMNDTRYTCDPVSQSKRFINQKSKNWSEWILEEWTQYILKSGNERKWILKGIDREYVLWWERKWREKNTSFFFLFFFTEKWENYYFDCLSDTEIQTVLSFLQDKVNEIGRGFDSARSELVNQRPNNELSGIIFI